jgi:hypothetical protein
MRINLNNQVTIDQVMELCQELSISPTRLIIDLIDRQHAQIGCKDNANTEENTKDTLQ